MILTRKTESKKKIKKLSNRIPIDRTELLKQALKKEKFTVKVIFFPIHPGAREKAVSIVCDGKNWDGLLHGYSSRNQCERGKNLVDRSFQFVMKIGVRGTPSFVFPNGELRVGAFSEEQILSKVKAGN